MASVTPVPVIRIRKSTVMWLAGCAGTSIVVIAAILGSLSYKFGSLSAARAYLRGQRLVLIPTDLDLGIGERGEKRHVSLQLFNLSGVPVRIIGAHSNCGCLVVRDNLPDEIPAGGSQGVSVDITFTGTERSFSHTAQVFAESDDGLTATATLKGTIRNLVEK